jgi:repressor LexA
MTLPVSAPQLQLLNAFADFAVDHGRTPSVRELCALLGRAPSTVHQLLRALERKGLMENDGSAHGWRLRPARTTQATREPSSVRVRVRGTIAAGRPIGAIEADDECVLFPSGQVDGDTFALRVRGDSMIDDHILDGDVVLVHRQARVEDGEIAVALLDDGTATLKRVFREPSLGRVRLQPANPALDPIYVSRVAIQGKVVGVVRTFPRD